VREREKERETNGRYDSVREREKERETNGRYDSVRKRERERKRERFWKESKDSVPLFLQLAVTRKREMYKREI